MRRNNARARPTDQSTRTGKVRYLRKLLSLRQWKNTDAGRLAERWDCTPAHVRQCRNEAMAQLREASDIEDDARMFDTLLREARDDIEQIEDLAKKARLKLELAREYGKRGGIYKQPAFGAGETDFWGEVKAAKAKDKRLD